MDNDTRGSRTNDWSQIDTEAMARINPDAATMARAAVVEPAFAWSAEPQESSAPEYFAARTRRLPRAMALAGIGAGAAAAVATGLILAFGTHPASATVAAPNATAQPVSSAPTTQAAAPATPAAAPTAIAPVASSRRSDVSSTPNHNWSPRQSNPTSTPSTYTTSDDSSEPRQQGNQWPHDWRLFLPHFDNSNNSNGSSYDHDSSSRHGHSEHHDSSSDDHR
jgi:hypothetical protein